MSLLIKALEQAAKDRKAGRPDVQPASAAAPLEPTLEPLPPPRAPAKPAAGAAPPASASEPLALDATTTTATAAPRRAPSSLASLANADAQQQRARAAAVMQAGSSRSAELLGVLRANPVMLFGGLAVLFGIGFGIYVYLQIAHPGVFMRQVATRPQEKAGPAPVIPGNPPPTPPGLAEAQGAGKPAAEMPYDPVLSAAPAGDITGRAGDSGRIGATPPPSPAAGQESQLPVASSAVLERTPLAEGPRLPPGERSSQVPRERGSIRPPESRPETLAAAPAPVVTPAPKAPVSPAAVPSEPTRERINVSATAAQPRLNPSLSQAYAQLQSGETEEARALYARVVQDEPLNIDGLLGLAYIAAQENRSEDATRLYMKILQLNPRHAIAQAALIGLMGRADPAASESRLKQLIAREPSPFLHFILGNLYADQGLWSQAQQAYFQAHTLEPGNPDYAYNLAVGLDHLRQQKLALNFYRRAEQLANASGRSNFSVAHAQERIRLLSSQGQ